MHMPSSTQAVTACGPRPAAEDRSGQSLMLPLLPCPTDDPAAWPSGCTSDSATCDSLPGRASVVSFTTVGVLHSGWHSASGWSPLVADECKHAQLSSASCRAWMQIACCGLPASGEPAAEPATMASLAQAARRTGCLVAFPCRLPGGCTWWSLQTGMRWQQLTQSMYGDQREACSDSTNPTPKHSRRATTNNTTRHTGAGLGTLHSCTFAD